ncbi:pimeloyl-ACP methyl ester carboxylesterase [Rhizobium skierniewicense]|uniref:Pimeloyl-ACP methyl ester carboxylesterase n=1 Tax=Rhizobium skierniewicense TaxID=984260 RepID=A0A7W6CBL5_9HYPH|nr:alpha/beta hydrolase [Rhizobium skierniewicense]MBB3948114.1 pimeloyl-ACP methyl ester carboxylesterase [Rhizobium skierniewicense]
MRSSHGGAYDPGYSFDQSHQHCAVHGAPMDGSSWRTVHDILKAKGFDVAVAQLPLSSLEADIAAARLVISRQAGRVVLVGHSYGGVVASVAGVTRR